MSLASLINWLQTVISNRTLRGPSIVQYFGFVPVWVCDFIFGILNKIDVTVPSPLSRIDRNVLDSRKQSETNKVPNEQKLAIVTGANSGIGYETAKALGRAGFAVIMACRNVELGTQAVARLERQTGLTETFTVMQLDLASLASIDKFVKDIKARSRTVDILVNNAGIMACPYAQTADGIEMQFGTNHVGHFALTVGLLDELKNAADGARVVVVASIAAFMQMEIDYQQIDEQAKYHKYQNYGISKLANILFATALARKLEGTRVTVNVLHPGTIATQLLRHMSASTVGVMAQQLVLDRVVTGATTSIHLALSSDVKDQTGQMYSRSIERPLHPTGASVEAQDKLWEYTGQLIAKCRSK
ncbi:Retinol dehydrogenase 13 [Coemansia sp. RSA 1807]|nr:Retinol dehydrogenase 13 [Coemansia sp. RSA 921]KAJ2275552.1 Retinol dehydrogenase 13 [Coemansia sp. RSA 451]KAJ2532454.1 Retinol dehydrogenase 13 [Coemansia sp. RSA 1937]KAJ2574418.1 Retinol dehydrogenase 13 [Coemansia sp. RSA 1807]